MYCSGGKAEENLTGSAVTISGGTFEDNKANELGGAISAWGSTTVVVITGGLFNNNTARYVTVMIVKELIITSHVRHASNCLRFVF